ncbi:hypothetical protein CRG98_044916 [Punica granatum]|nr:hypothetical protein CRG98_044916 [Punica granatum]
MTFLSLNRAITIGGAFFLYAAIAAAAWAFFYTMMPETQGRTLEEMEKLFGRFFRWKTSLRDLQEEDKKAVNGNVDGGRRGEVQLGEGTNGNRQG